MSNIHPHDLHQAVRSWLLAEDPYGMNNLNARQEPSMGDNWPAGWQDTQGNQIGSARSSVPASQNPAAGGTLPAPTSGPTAEQGNALRASNYGRGAVDRALNYPQPPSRYSEAERNPRAQAQGASAVDTALNQPLRYSEAARDPRAQAWGEQAVEGAAQPQPLDMSGAPGYASPEEAQMTASAAGQNAVGRALQDKARGKMSRGGYPMTAPGKVFGPQEVEGKNLGYAPSGKRASHYGKDAVERELDKEPE